MSLVLAGRILAKEHEYNLNDRAMPPRALPPILKIIKIASAKECNQLSNLKNNAQTIFISSNLWICTSFFQQHFDRFR